MKKLSVIILAAGKGSRMCSSQPKVLHNIANQPMINHLLDTAFQVVTDKVYIVCGSGSTQLQAALQDKEIHWVYQAQQLGTGHAVQQVLPYLQDDEDVLILYGDTPLIQVATLQKLVAEKPLQGLSLLTVHLAKPDGYGRIIRNDLGEITGVVEHKDASFTQLQLNEVNTGMMCVAVNELKHWLAKLQSTNAQQEFYLTDIIGFAYEDNKKIAVVHPLFQDETRGVNNRKQLAELERIYQQRQAEQLMLQGVSLLDPQRFDLRGTLTCGQDIVIDSNVIIKGKVSLGNNVTIDSGVVLEDCSIADNTHILPYSVIQGANIKQNCTVGPFARIRPGTLLQENVHIGNFVELKKVELGRNSKAGHLSYLGDSLIGDNVNIGAGAITCNYDGANKYQTIIGDDAFVGSDSQLIAPVSIGKGATVAAGSCVVKDVLENELVISRVKQRNISNWQRPCKKIKNSS